MSLPMVIKLLMFLIFLPIAIHKTMALIHTQGHHFDGWMKLTELPLAFIADALAVATVWLEAQNQLDKRLRRKKLRRDYDRQVLPPKKSAEQ